VGRPAVGTWEEPKGNLGSAGTILPGAVLVKVDALGGGAATVDRGQCGNTYIGQGLVPVILGVVAFTLWLGVHLVVAATVLSVWALVF
jgi:hypothetical protein